MKKQLLICSALALAGCSSAPDTGDAEKYLEPNFVSCQNIELVDIKKQTAMRRMDTTRSSSPTTLSSKIQVRSKSS